MMNPAENPSQSGSAVIESYPKVSVVFLIASGETAERQEKKVVLPFEILARRAQLIGIACITWNNTSIQYVKKSEIQSKNPRRKRLDGQQSGNAIWCLSPQPSRYEIE